MESEQANRPSTAVSEADAAVAPVRSAPVEPPAPADGTTAIEERGQRRLSAGRRRSPILGPALLSVPERRRLLVSPEAPADDSTIATPIKMPTVGPIIPPIGPVGTSPAQPKVPIRPPAARAGLRRRHKFTLASFVIVVLTPLVLIAGYLFISAQDQYASIAGFSIRKEEGAATVDMLGGLSQITGSASTDAEILYDYIRSPDLVARVDQDLDLFSIYGRDYTGDPWFSLKPDANIEAKQSYWESMVKVEYNESTGLLGLEVRAFSPEEAQKIGQAIIGYSSLMINRLAEAAREDATRYAREELARAGGRLKEIRVAIMKYRSDNQVLDPTTDAQGRQVLINKLEEELAGAMIDLDVLKAVARENDSRLPPMEIRIATIERRLADERQKFGIGPDGAAGGRDYAQIVAEYEGLAVDREVAEEAFRSATLIYNNAQAEANRKSRYLAAHVEPTLAQGSIYPSYWQILLMTGVILFLGWSLATLIFYSIRDRR